MRKFFYSCTIVILIYSNLLFGSSQNLSSESSEAGTPFVTNYSPSIYESHGQNWAIVQDNDGFMYFGNTDGVVLQYDGVSWRKIAIDNASIVRSLAIDTGGVVYVGAQNEIGYLIPDSIGTLNYISIVSEIPQKFRNFGDVWQIHFVDDQLHFSTRKYLFRRNTNGSYNIWHAEKVFHSSFNIKGQLFIHQRNIGLMTLINDSLEIVSGGEIFKEDWVYVMVPLSNRKILIASRNNGLFLFDDKQVRKFKSTAEKWLITNHVYNGTRLKNNNIILSTLRGGLLILDEDGRVLKIIDKESGLMDNQIWYVFNDLQNNIWLAMNKGIARLEYPSNWSYYNESNGLEGNAHDIKRHEGYIYAATGMGVYRLKKGGNKSGKNYFELLKGLKSQSWALLSFNKRLLVSCNHGIFEFRNENFHQITKKSAWQFHISKRDSNRVYLGLDQGVSSIYFKEGKWIEEERLPGFNANSRTLAEDNFDRLWVGTVYEGVYQFEFEDETQIVKNKKHFTEGSGLPSPNYNLVFPFGDKIVFGTTNGVFTFDDSTEIFKPLAVKDKYLQTYESYTIISEGRDGSLYYNANEKLVCLVQDSIGNFTASFKPYLRLPETSIYTIFSEPKGVIWLGSPEGIYRFDPNIKMREDTNHSVHIRRVLSFGDSIIYNGTNNTDFKAPKLSYTSKAMRFEFAIPYFISSDMTTYRYRLEGFEDDWSGWTTETKKDYTNIPGGNFTFLVQAKNLYGQISSTSKFDFEILSPIYKRWWAYVLYISFILFLLIIIIRQLLSYTRKKTILEQQKIEQTRKKMEEDLRSQVAADFHDELGTQITRISLFSEILKNDLVNISDNAKNYLEKISQNADNLYNETRDFIWQLDPKNDTLLDFISRIKNFADDLLEETKINFEIINRISNPEKIRLPMEIRRNLIRIFKEALHNSFKYAQCKSITFELEKESKEIKFILSDDGVGFDTTEYSDGNGLINMLNRAKKINGKLQINSNEENGTQIKLTVGL